MSTWSRSHGAHRGARSLRRSRRIRWSVLAWEPLETRQLLATAVFPAAIASGEGTQPATIQPSLSLTPLMSSGSPVGLSPAQLATAYGVNQIAFKGNVVGNGSGQTIAIIDAYYDPSIQSDLSKFDAQYGLAAPPSLTQYVESGLRYDNAGWALETALDVEWAHAIAPDATIVLVEAYPDLSDLFSAVSFASSLSGVSVVSMSWGAGEFSGESSYDSVFTTPPGHTGITFVAASGDSATVEYPSSSPNVLAVGGTTLNLNSNGTYGSETGWSDSGGGYSADEPAQSWQTAALQASGLSTTARTTPDVAWDANPSTGVAVYSSVGRYGWVEVGGTSVGAPSWAGLIAIADQGLALAHQGTLSNAQTSLYKLPSSDFNDITSGSTPYHSAGSGYDLVTGLGSPKANLLIPALVAANGGNSALIANANQHSSISISPSPSDIVVIITAPPTFPTGGSGSGSGSSSSSGSGSGGTSSTGSSSSTAIAPLTPVILAGSNSRTPIIVIVVPQPLVVPLGPSSAPVTTQAILSVVTNEEQPTISTHFGQPATNQPDDSKLEQPVARPATWPTTLDVIEPFQPVPLEVPGAGQPAAPRDAARSRVVPDVTGPGLQAVRDLSVAELFSGSLADSWQEADRPAEVRLSCGLSTIFGAAALAAGGYHLVLRQSDRFRGRWSAGRTATRRSRFGLPIG
jgi:hypothetical protein